MGPLLLVRVCSQVPGATSHYIYIHLVEIVRATLELDTLEVATTRSTKREKKVKDWK